MEELCHFDLHGGLKTPRMYAIPHRMGIGPQSYYAHEVMNLALEAPG